MHARKYGEKISTTTTGKILNVLLKEHKIQAVSDISGKHIPKARKFTGHAQRLPKGMKPKQVGELIQIDQMTVDIPGVGERKEFHAICPISKFIVTKIYKKLQVVPEKTFLIMHKQIFHFLSCQLKLMAEVNL